jgi:hypothetical protein
MSRLKVCETNIVNRREVDIYIRDAFGKEHVLFPQEMKIITTIVETAHRRSPISDGLIQEK